MDMMRKHEAVARDYKIFKFFHMTAMRLNCTTVSQEIRDFDEHKKSICYFVKSKLFHIKKCNEADLDLPGFATTKYGLEA